VLAGLALAIGCDDGSTRLWEPATGQPLSAWRSRQDTVQVLAFSPCGRLVASGGRDGSILVWDVPSAAGPIAAGRPLSRQELAGLWADLVERDAPRGHRAVWSLATAPREALPWVAGRLRPVPVARRQCIDRLLAGLDDERFDRRQRATVELAELAEGAERALRQARDGRPTPEVRWRVEQLLARLRPDAPERLRQARALAVLLRAREGSWFSRERAER
jgi:hypothetical protein